MKSRFGQPDVVLDRVTEWRKDKKHWEDIFSFKLITSLSTLRKLEDSWDKFLEFTKFLSELDATSRLYGGMPGVNITEIQADAREFLGSAEKFFKKNLLGAYRLSMAELEKWEAQKAQWENFFTLKSLPDKETAAKLLSSWDDFIALTRLISANSTGIYAVQHQVEARDFLQRAATFFDKDFNNKEPEKTELPTQDEVQKLSLELIKKWQVRTDVKEWRKIFSQKRIPDEEIWLRLTSTWADLVLDLSKIIPENLKLTCPALQQDALDFLKDACKFFGKDFDKIENILIDLPPSQFFQRTNILVDSLQGWQDQAKKWEEIFDSDTVDNQKWLTLIKSWDQFIKLTQKLSDLQELNLDKQRTTLVPYQNRANEILEKGKKFFHLEESRLLMVSQKERSLPIQHNLERMSVKQLEDWRTKKGLWEGVFALGFPSEATWTRLANDWEIFKSITQNIYQFEFGPTPLGTTRSSLQQEATQFLEKANAFFYGGSQKSIVTLPAKKELPHFENIKILHKWQKQKKDWLKIFSLRALPSKNELEILLRTWESFIKVSKQIASLSNNNLGFNTTQLQQEASQFLDEVSYFFNEKLVEGEPQINQLKIILKERVDELKNWQEQKRQWEAIFSSELILDKKERSSLVQAWDRFLKLTTQLASPNLSTSSPLQKEAQEFLQRAQHFFSDSKRDNPLPNSKDLENSLQQYNWGIQKKQWENIFSSVRPYPDGRMCYTLLETWDEFIERTQEEVRTQSYKSMEAQQFLSNAANFFDSESGTGEEVQLPTQKELQVQLDVDIEMHRSSSQHKTESKLAPLAQEIKETLAAVDESTKKQMAPFSSLIAIQKRIEKEYQEIEQRIKSETHLRSRLECLTQANDSISQCIEQAKQDLRRNILNPAIDNVRRGKASESITEQCIVKVNDFIAMYSKELAKSEVDLNIYEENSKRVKTEDTRLSCIAVNPEQAKLIINTARDQLESEIVHDQAQYIENRWRSKKGAEAQTLSNNKERCKSTFIQAYTKILLQHDSFFNQIRAVQERITDEINRIESEPNHNRNHIAALKLVNDKIKSSINKAIGLCAEELWSNQDLITTSVSNLKIKENNKTEVRNIIKTDILANRTLDFSWREKIGRFFDNLVAMIKPSSKTEFSSEEIKNYNDTRRNQTFFGKMTSTEHKNIEEIFNDIDKIKVGPNI
ncbi:hypothetical protein [Legionella gresilensis]|uniref:hypothetical protein n=1 Tax=Legionella gresilensis TaxID=91823 RepID=UPI001041A0C8|nr:hypothetical protein [Legionella gresilensis]